MSVYRVSWPKSSEVLDWLLQESLVTKKIYFTIFFPSCISPRLSPSCRGVPSYNPYTSQSPGTGQALSPWRHPYLPFPLSDMFSFNRVHLIGYQTQPVQVRQTPGGTSVTDLNLVVPYTFKAESGEQLSGKSFHTVTLWGPMADVASRFVKAGSQLFISGRLQTDSWEDPTSKEKRSKTKIVGLDMIMLDPKDGQLPSPNPSSPLLSTVNRADIIGNVTRDPEMRTTTSGQKVLTLGVATNERWKEKGTGEDKERSEFHNIVVWGALAEAVAQGVHKGNRVAVSGRIQTRSWETKEGAKRTTTEIIADTLSLLGTKNSAVESSIDPSGARASSRGEGGNDFSQDQTPAAIPEISYASEIKAEDLPF